MSADWSKIMNGHDAVLGQRVYGAVMEPGQSYILLSVRDDLPRHLKALHDENMGSAREMVKRIAALLQINLEEIVP